MNDVKSSKIRLIFSSPQNRALDTAVELFRPLLRNRNMKISVVPEFGIGSRGSNDDLSHVKAHYGPLVDFSNLQGPQFRIRTFLSELSQHRCSRRTLEVAIVTHNAVMPSILPGTSLSPRTLSRANISRSGISYKWTLLDTLCILQR